MIDAGPKSNRFAKAEVWVMAVFSLVGTTLGVGTLIIVYWVMAGFRAEMIARHPERINDPAFMEALATDQRVMMVIAALVSLGVLLNVMGMISVIRACRGRPSP